MLYIIRHCSTTENELGILCSDKDYELSKKGIQQGHCLSQWFSDKKIDLILTSNLLRAKQTANFVRSVTNAQVKECEELSERNVGITYSNLRLAELKATRLNRGQDFFDPTQDWNAVLSVESDESVFKRIKSVLQTNYSPEMNLACVTHAGVIKSFVHSVFQMDKSRTNAFKVRNGCVLVFQNENDFVHLQLMGMYQF
jgi:broad specificity phosphatase PhoE